MMPQAEQPADAAVYEQARALLRNGQVAEGIALLRSLSGRMPKVLGDIAWACRMRNDNDAAMAALREYVEKFPADPGAWALMARIERDRSDLGAAARYARRAVEINPDDAQLCFDLGEVLFLARDWKGASRAYAASLRINPDQSLAQVRQQHALRMRGFGRFRRLSHWRPARAVARRLLSSRVMRDLIEIDMGIASEDRRWQSPVEWGGAPTFIESSPAGQEAEDFAAHFAQCRCAFWKWYRTLPLEGRLKEVLEIGAGSGHVAHHFALSGLNVLCVAADDAARRDLEQRNLPVIGQDVHLIPRPGGSFDLIVADYALPHSRAVFTAVSEWKRLLRPDGHLLVMAHLALDGPAPGTVPEPENRREFAHFAFGVPGHVMTLTYWQLRWLFRQAGLFLIGETLLDPKCDCLESIEHVDGRRPPDPSRAWDALFLLRKPGRLPCNRDLEKPRRPYYRTPG